MTILVTGATGTTGSRVAALLEQAGADVRRASRSAPVRFDWSDPATHGRAFDGADALYLVSPLDTTEPAAVVAPLLERAVARGLRRVALLGSSAVGRGDPGVGALADLVLRTVPEPVVLRPSWFIQNFTGDHPHAHGLRAGELVTATGDGRVPFVDAGDIAAVAAAVLSGGSAPEPELLVTGPEALSYAEVCAIYTDVTGRPARHVPVTADELAARLTGARIPAGYAAFLAGLDRSVAAGGQAAVADTVERLTGRRPRAVREVFSEVWGEAAAVRQLGCSATRLPSS